MPLIVSLQSHIPSLEKKDVRWKIWKKMRSEQTVPSDWITFSKPICLQRSGRSVGGYRGCRGEAGSGGSEEPADHQQRKDEARTERNRRQDPLQVVFLWRKSCRWWGSYFHPRGFKDQVTGNKGDSCEDKLHRIHEWTQIGLRASNWKMKETRWTPGKFPSCVLWRLRKIAFLVDPCCGISIVSCEIARISMCWAQLVTSSRCQSHNFRCAW